MTQRHIPDAARGWRFGIFSAAVGAVMLLSPAWAQQEPPDDPFAQPPAAERTEAIEQPGEAEPDAGVKTAEDVTMTHQGEFVRAEGDSFTMTHEGREHSHRVQKDVRITLNGRPAELSDLRRGDRIRVTTPKTELGVAVAIMATREDDAAAANQPREDQPRDSRQPQDQPDDPQRNEQDQGEQQAALGVLLGESRGGGVLIRDVAPGGPADQAGIRPGDYILLLNDQRVNSAQGLAESVQRMEIGDRATLGVWRNEREMNVDVTVGSQRDLAFRQDRQPRLEGRPQGEGRDADRAWLGVMLRDPRERPPAEDEPADQEGVVVERVHPGGPAARAGLRSGDAIIRVGEHEVQSLDDLYAAMDRLEPNQQATLVVTRNGEEQELGVTPTSRSEFFEDQDEFRGFRQPRPPFGPGLVGPPGRGMAPEQNRRLEELLNNVLEEVQQLRQEVRQLQGDEARQPVEPGAPGRPAAPGLPRSGDEARQPVEPVEPPVDNP